MLATAIWIWFLGALDYKKHSSPMPQTATLSIKDLDLTGSLSQTLVVVTLPDQDSDVISGVLKKVEHTMPRQANSAQREDRIPLAS